MAKKDKDAAAAPDADAKTKAPETPVDQAAPAKPEKAPKAKKAAAADESSGQRKRRGRPMRGRSKRHSKHLEKVERDKRYNIEDAVKLLKQVTTGTKFDQTINIVLHLGIDPKQADQMIRGAVSLPRGIGKTKRVIAFCEGDDAERAKAAGAVEAGIDDLVKKITDGWTDFDVAIAHPRSMGKVGKLGRVLGPQGKMPTPKNGTVTDQVDAAVREFAAGKIEFRNDTGGNIHAIIGKASFQPEDLKENLAAFINHIRRMKPPTSKGVFMKKVCISGTMSPSIELEVAQQ